MSKPKETINSIDRACRLLKELAHMGAASLSELAAALDLPTTTVDRILSSLSEHGFVERANDRWRPGKELAALWAVYQRLMTEILEQARRNLADTAAPLPVTHVGSKPEEWSQ